MKIINIFCEPFPYQIYKKCEADCKNTINLNNPMPELVTRYLNSRLFFLEISRQSSNDSFKVNHRVKISRLRPAAIAIEDITFTYFQYIYDIALHSSHCITFIKMYHNYGIASH